MYKYYVARSTIDTANYISHYKFISLLSVPLNPYRIITVSTAGKMRPNLMEDLSDADAAKGSDTVPILVRRWTGRDISRGAFHPHSTSVVGSSSCHP